jgi:tRNA 2-thiouridine synthesizing protein B
MSTLHTVNKSPFSHTALNSCLTVCGPDDGVILLEDGIYGAMASAPSHTQLKEILARGIRVYALKPDVDARGIGEKLMAEVELADYEKFVQLSVQHRCVQSWY